jgi:hypothetical protein
MNLNGNAMLNMSPEDRIRQLIAAGANPNSARAVSDTLSHVSQAGQPQGVPGANQLADALRQQGHAVRVNG